jgi:transketolase
MELPLIHIYTHDSIGVGEDGPTHPSIEHLASLRAMPSVIDMRPADGNEVAEAWRALMPIRHQPVALMPSRQPLPTLDRSKYASAAGVAKGAYVLADPPSGERPEVILIATGSEVAMTVDAYEQLTADGIKARVVSMPSMELFDMQPRDYRDDVLPPSVTARVAVEKGSTFGWDRWVGLTGAIIGMSTYGASASLKVLQATFGFSVEHIVATARAQPGLAHDTDAPGVTLETSGTSA